MTKTELNNYRSALEEKQAELEQTLRNRDGIAISDTADSLDKTILAAESDQASRNLSRDSDLLRNVQAALHRLDEGTYGVCLHCEEDIAPKRLRAVPWTPYCIQCQELVDRRREAGEEELMDDILVRAAAE